jgi:hypothetical protein
MSLTLKMYIYQGNKYSINDLNDLNKFDVLNYIYDNNLYDESFIDGMKTLSTLRCNFKVFKWLHNKFPNITLNNILVGGIFGCKEYQEYIEYIIDNVYYDYIDLDNIRYDENQIQYCINNMHQLKLKYTSKMIQKILLRTSADVGLKMQEYFGELLNFILQASLDGKLDISIWSDEILVDSADENYLEWLYDKYKLNLIPFNYSRQAINSAVYNLKKIKWWISKQNEFIKDDYKDNIAIQKHKIDFEILKYLIEEQNVISIKIDIKTIESFIVNVQIRNLEYLFDNRHYLQIEELFSDKYINEWQNFVANIFNIKLLNWMYTKHKSDLFPFKYTHKAFDNAVNYNRYDVFNFFINNCIQNKGDLELLHTVDSDDFSFRYITKTMGSLLLTNRDLIKIKINRLIDTVQNIEILDELYLNYRNEFHFTSDAIDNCQYSYILLWWFKHAIECGGRLELLYTELAIDSNLIGNPQNPNILKLWYDFRFKFNPQFTKEYLISYVHRDYDDRKYLLDLIKS